MAGTSVTAAQTAPQPPNELNQQIRKMVAESEGSSAVKRTAALIVLTTLNDSTTTTEVRTRINGTLEDYRGPHHVDRRVFRDDLDALSALRESSLVQKSSVLKSSHLLADADRKLAVTATEEAERLVSNSSVGPADREAANGHLAAARDAIAAGQAAGTVPVSASNAKQIRGHIEAVAKYDLAWQHAQAAVDIIDAETAPVVRLQSRYDAVVTNDTTNRTIRGTVTDPRAWELDSVVVESDSRRRVVSLKGSSAINESATFTAQLQGVSRVTNISVRAEDRTTEVRTVSEITPTFSPLATLTGTPSEPAAGGSGGASGAGAQRGGDDPSTTDQATRTPVKNVTVQRLSVDPTSPSVATSVSILVDVTSLRSDSHTERIQLEIDGEIVASRTVSFDGNETRAVSFTHKFATEGRHSVRVGSLNRSVTIASAEETATGTDLAQTTPVETDEPQSSPGDDPSQTSTPAVDGQPSSVVSRVEAVVETVVDVLTDAVDSVVRMLAGTATTTPPRQIDASQRTAESATSTSASQTNFLVAQNEANQSDVGTASVAFDGDGLPDVYETAVLGSDPLDYDSNITAAAPGGDGRIDGYEDPDNDSASNYLEFVHSGDPFDSDTDDDDLGDNIEFSTLKLNASNPDSDGDGIPDAEDDPDGDTLSTLTEIQEGTDPFAADTDFDSLSDGSEIANGTDPTAQDTDTDGLLDPEERRLSTDPRDPDTDGDGVLDGNETFSTVATTSVNDTAATVNVTGTGAVADTVTITDASDESNLNTSMDEVTVSPILDFQSPAEFENATISVEYESSETQNESDLSMYRFNRTLRTFIPLNSTINTSTGTVSAETTHFSKYVVLNSTRYERRFPQSAPTRRGSNVLQQANPINVVFLMDSSGSMDRNDPSDIRVSAARQFVGRLVSFDRAAVVDFDSAAYTAQRLTGDFAAVNSSLAVGSSGGTDIEAAISEGNSVFDGAENTSDKQVMILLTDGRVSYYHNAKSAARVAAEDGHVIHTIGFGDAERPLLRDIANITDGSYNYIESADDLPELFTRVANYTTRARDSDGDGISDKLEEAGIPTGVRGNITTDPENPDTDGDGLADGEEIGDPRNITRVTVIDGERRYVNRSYYMLYSDPTTPDTDGDGLSDATEAEPYSVYTTTSKTQTAELLAAARNNESIEPAMTNRTVRSDPYFADTDGDSLTDAAERYSGTDPTRADSDGDSAPDDVEIRLGGSPTLYDVTPPKITVHSASAYKKSFSLKTRYEVFYEVEDVTGVERSGVYKDTDREGGYNHGGKRDPYAQVFRFTTTLPDTSLDALDGASVKVKSTDIAGNERSVLAYSRSNFYGEQAAMIGSDNIFTRQVAVRLGMLSGFSVGAGQALSTLKFLVEFREELFEYITQLRTLMETAREERLGIVPIMLDALGQAMRSTMELNNPYNETTQQGLYSTYRDGFYSGYLLFMLAETFLPSKAATIAKQFKTVQRVLDAAPTRAINRLRSGLNTIRHPASAVGGLLYSRVISDQAMRIAKRADFDSGAAKRLLSHADSVGDQVTIALQLRRIDSKKITGLSDQQQRLVGNLLSETGPKGRQLVEDLDENQLRRALSAGPRIDTEGTGGAWNFRASYLRALSGAHASDSVSRSELTSVIDNVAAASDRDQRILMQVVSRTGDNGVKMLADVPPQKWQNIVRFQRATGEESYEFVREMGVLWELPQRTWTLTPQTVDDVGEWQRTLVDVVVRNDDVTALDAQRYLYTGGKLASATYNIKYANRESYYAVIRSNASDPIQNTSVQFEQAMRIIDRANRTGASVKTLDIGSTAGAFVVRYNERGDTNVRTFVAGRPLSGETLAARLNRTDRWYNQTERTGELVVVVDVRETGTLRDQSVENVTEAALSRVGGDTTVDEVHVVKRNVTVELEVGAESQASSLATAMPTSPKPRTKPASAT